MGTGRGSIRSVVRGGIRNITERPGFSPGGGSTPPGGGGVIPITQTWAESASSGRAWTSFVADGSDGFTATSDGASVAIIPADVTELDGDTVAYNFTIDTLSAGTIEFGVDESGTLLNDSIDSGSVTRVSGGTRSGARALFTTTGEKVVYITSKKTNGLNALRPKFKYNEAGGVVVISGFSATAGQALDMWTAMAMSFDFNHDPEGWGIYDSRNGRYGMESLSNNYEQRASYNGVTPKVGHGCFYQVTTNSNRPSIGRSYNNYKSEDWLDVVNDFRLENVTVEEVTFGGYDKVIKITCGSETAAAKQIRSMQRSTTYRGAWNAFIWIPSTNTYVDSVSTLTGTDGVGIIDNISPAICGADQWVGIGADFYNQSYCGLALGDNNVLTGADWSGDVIYIRAINSRYMTNYGGLVYAQHPRWFDAITDFSYAFWYKPNAVSDRAVFGFAEQGTSGVPIVWVEQTVGGEFKAGFRDDTPANHTVETSGLNYDASTWYHIYVSVSEGNFLNFWVNSQLIGTIDLTGLSAVRFANEDMWFGYGNNYGHGWWDCFRTWEYAGNQLHVNFEYNLGVGTTWEEILETKPAEIPYPDIANAYWLHSTHEQFIKRVYAGGANDYRLRDYSGNDLLVKDDGYNGLAPKVYWKDFQENGAYLSGSYTCYNFDSNIDDYTNGITWEFFLNYNDTIGSPKWLVDDGESSAYRARATCFYDYNNSRWRMDTGSRDGVSGGDYLSPISITPELQ